jgi:hypothetical protein
MGTHLTERVVKAAEIGTRKYVVFDQDCAGFGLCVYDSGRKGFVLIYQGYRIWPRMVLAKSSDHAARLRFLETGMFGLGSDLINPLVFGPFH